MTDPEVSVEVNPLDLAEAAADFGDDSDRSAPLEASEADVLEQMLVVEGDEDDYRG
jgi:hypothetical protein